MATITKLTLFKKEKAKLKIFWTKILLFLLTKIKYYSIIKVEKGGKIMIYGCYTFKELQEKYGWTCTQGEIQKQITYARNRGVLIEKAFKQGKTYFKILNDNNPPEEEWETYVNDPYFEVTKGGMVRTSTDKKIVSTKNTDGYLTVTSSNPNNYVIFNNEANTAIGHVGIYIGDGNFIHASNPKDGVKITTLLSGYYKIRYVGARRVI